MLLHISSHPRHGHSVPVLQVGDQYAEGQGDLSLVRVEAAKQGAKLLSRPSAQGALALIAALLPNCVLLQCSFVLFLGLALFQEAQWTEGTRAVGAALFPLDYAAEEKRESRLYATPGCDLGSPPT